MTASPTVASQSTTRLDGQLGTRSIVFMVIAAAAPLTVIGGNVPLAVGSGNGAGAPIGFALAAIILLLFSVGFVTMTPFVKEAGAFFSYVTAGLGSRLGLGTAFTALVAYTAIQVGVYGYMGWAVGDLVTYFGGPDLPWWLYSFAAMAIVAVLGYRHIDLSARVLGVALALEILVVVVLDIVIFATGGDSGIAMQTFDPATVFTPGIGVAVLFALTGFIGFEATAVFRDEARTPEKTIPRATYIAVIVIGVFYAVSCWALITGVGANNAVAVAQKTLAGDGNLLLDTATQYLGPIMRDVIQVLLVTSLFACVLSFHNVIARYQFSLANKGVLPAALGRRHTRHHSPSVSSIVQTITAAVVLAVLALSGLDPLVGVFGSMAGVATVGMVILMLLTSVAVFFFFLRRPALAEGHAWGARVFPVLAVLGLIIAMWLVLSNFTLVTGGSVAVSTALALVPVVALLLGIVLGARLRLDGGAAIDADAEAPPA
ncbi:amino acid/polyamine/organocation transporter, APC superfamily [Agreia bicolorata]|uniref:Amino acid/polyamine/organocation transporter, APC superfamily n=1 Tax=Agreia bicolorata TaxID=110935 RepID=A0A1T4Y6F6_9MICO|nr:APC family permease [Agreia bicolorata]SKA97387.1 amino acid/polyamine/organocation transporter, APC superfamily [Agreia bicolorata]